MSENIGVYVSVLCDSLKEKWEVLKKINEVSENQKNLLDTQEPDVEQFEKSLEQKDILIKKMLELDEGFDRIFKKIDKPLHEQKEEYKQQILEMQNYIRLITECSVKIQALEARNKDKFVAFSQKKHREIKEFRQNNKTANTYYQNMANQHRQWQSYFLDKKK